MERIVSRDKYISAIRKVDLLFLKRVFTGSYTVLYYIRFIYEVEVKTLANFSNNAFLKNRA